MSARKEWTLCVDFGTAFSKAAAAPRGAWSRFEPGKVRPLMLGGHEEGGNAFLLDSAVFIDTDRVLLGRAAVDRANALAHKKRLALRSFKTLLSVSDLDRALNTNAPASIDPHRIFPMRDLMVLYLAYLSAAVAQAVSADPLLSGAAISRRYAAPAWRSGDSAGMHASVLRLLGEAEAARSALGKRLLAPEGVPLDLLSEALPRALAEPEPIERGLVFEATAAAAYTSIGLADSPPHMIVIDVGAGTTDIAAVARVGEGMEEIEEARITLKRAGDFIDRVIANVVLDANKWAKTPEQQAELWRLLMMHMRDIKESVFADGRAVLRYEKRAITVAMRDLERNRDFRDFRKELERAYADSLEVVRKIARADKRRVVQAVAVGGGAAAPFVQELIARRPRNGNIRVQPRPATPEWAFAPEFGGNLAPVFPQLAIAIGGALAPESIVAASGTFSPAAADRSDSPAGRG